MSLLRAFIAIEIPPEIKKTISAQTANLQKDTASSVRWVASENIHLTFKFLGEISAVNVEILAQALKTECEQCQPFEITVEKLGCFPNSRRPRVLWVGLVVPQELNRLQRQIEAVTSRMGYATEEKPFSPHLTIGRVREQASSAELQALHTLLEQTRIATLGTFTVREVHLFKSDLKPSGPVYTRLSTALLK